MDKLWISWGETGGKRGHQGPVNRFSTELSTVLRAKTATYGAVLPQDASRGIEAHLDRQVGQFPPPLPLQDYSHGLPAP